VAAGSLDDPGGDGPARGQGLVVAQELLLAGQVADAGVRAVPLIGGKAGGVRFGGDFGGCPRTVPGQHGERFDRYPVLGGRVGGGVQGPCGFPDVFELSRFQVVRAMFSQVISLLRLMTLTRR
jgi:hypothetical protein